MHRALYGQISGAGTIQGTVTDFSGAVIPGVQIKIVEIKTNVEHDQTSTSAGFYSAGGLEPGIYKVIFSAPGFKTLTQENVSVDAIQVVGLNVKLAVGSSSTTVTVTSAPPQLNTTNATLGSSMETETYKALPLILNGQPRDPTAFIYLTPGVTGGGGVNQMNGGQSNLNETYIDGVAMDDVNQQGDWAVVHSTLSVDAVDQFQVQTSGISAAYQGQGMQNYVHKSGTNTYHGSIFEYFRNTVLDTWGFYAPYSINPVTGTAIKPVEQQNEWGGTFGGYVPHFKDKIFFFISYDNDHYLHGVNPSYTTIPTAAERIGDFSALLSLPTPQPIYDPATTNCTTNPCTRNQFSYQGRLNVIDPSRLSPISQYMQHFLPAPSNSNLTNNYLGGFNTGFTYPRQSYKLDFDMVPDHIISLLFLEGGRYANPACCDSSGLPLPYTDTVGNSQNNLTAVISDTWTINDRIVNKLNYAFNANGFHGIGSINPSEGNPAWAATAAGITNIPPGQASEAFPYTSFGGANAPISWANGRANHGATNVYHLQDGLQILKGRNSISLGGEYQWQESDPVSIDTGTYLSLSYSNNETAGFNGQTVNTKQGAGYASFMIGAVDGAGITDNRPAAVLYGRYHNFSPYVQDDIKATERLTLNLGLRWDIFSPWTEKLNRFSFINLGMPNPVTGTPGTLQFGGSGTSGLYCNCQTPISTWYKNFGPRIGFAYAIDTKTVVRGAFGIYYSHAGGVGGRVDASSGSGQLGFNGGGDPSSPNNGITPGFYLNSTNTAVPGYTLPPNIDPANGTGYTTNPNYASLSPIGVNYPDPYLGRRAPYYENFNLGFQREIAPQTTLSVDYSGSNGHFLGTGIGRGIYSNQLDPSTYVLGGLLNQKATPSNIAAAQAILPSFHLPFAAFSPDATIGQALRPFAQYNGFSDIWGDIGNSNYSSLQIALKQTPRNGFNYGLSYTFSKTYDDTGTSRSAYGIGGARADVIEHALSTIDIPSHATFYAVYESPFGRSGGFRFTNLLIKNWAASFLFSYLSGTPVTITSTGCNTPYAGTCMPDLNPNYSHSPRINGGWGRKNLATGTNIVYIDPAAFSIPAAYTFGNAARTYPFGLRNPGGHDEDLSLRRAFGIRENLKFTFEASAFNLDNHTDFSGPNAVFGSTSFGTVTGQANASRDIQFSGRLEF